MSYVLAPGYRGLGADDFSSGNQKALAKGIAERVTGSTSGKAFDVASKVAEFGIGQAMIAADYIGGTQAGKAMRHAGSAGAMAYSIIAKAKDNKYSPDASGVVDAAQDVDRFLGSVLSFAGAAGANQEVLNKISSWTSVGTTCAIGVTAAVTSTGVGAVAGGVACAFAVLGQVLAEIFGAEKTAIAGHDRARTIFQMNAENKAMIAGDALRLAKLLRHHYGVRSFRQLVSALDHRKFTWISQKFPGRPPAGPDRKLTSPEEVIPAHNLDTILHMMAAQQYKENASFALKRVQDGLAILAEYRNDVEPSGRELFQVYNEDNDINVQTIGNGAFFGRCAAATTSSCRVKGTLLKSNDTRSWPGGNGTHTVDMLPFVQVDEMINFFAAVSRVEQLTYGRGYLQQYRFGLHNPVRFMSVGDSGSISTKWDEYSRKCWTDLRSESGQDPMRRNCDQLISKVLNGEHAALREFGAMRLMAAMSYLHMSWYWSGDADRQDPLAIDEELNEINAPVDPRQVIHHGGGRVTLRNDDGFMPDAPKSKVARFENARAARDRRSPPVFPTAGKATITSEMGIPFNVANAPTMTGWDVYRDSNVNVTYIGQNIANHNALVTKVMREVAARSNVITSSQILQLISRQEVAEVVSGEYEKKLLYDFRANVAQMSPEMRQSIIDFNKPKEIIDFNKPKKESGAPLLIGAAALAALLLLK